MLNNEFIHDRSTALADRVAQVAETPADHIKTAWLLALGRPPTNSEVRLARSHLASQQARFQSPPETDSDADAVTADSLADKQHAPVLHLAADAGLVADDAGRVHSWHSQTEQHHAVQQDVTSQPLVVSDAINGQPALRFDGNKKFLKLSGELLDNEHCTMIAVATDICPEPRLREIISNWNRQDNVGTSVFLGLKDTNTVRFTDNFSDAGRISSPDQPFILTVVNSPDSVNVWQGNTLIASRPQSVTDRRFGTEWVIGQQGNIDGEYWHGDIAEVLVFNQPVAPGQLDSIWQRLADKYSITLSPPAEPPAKPSPQHLALTSLCHVLLNSNEFLYID
jgi:hypothetical protein